MSSTTPRVLVVIPSYNQRPLLEVSLDALRQTVYPAESMQCAVVDDASLDDTVAWLRQHHPQLLSLAQPRNLGFAGACNAGLSYALEQQYDYVALLNNDTRVDAHWLSALVDVAAADDAVGVVGGKIKSWDGALVEYAGNVFNITVAAGGYLDQPDDGSYDAIHPAAYACGASVLYRVSCLRQIGLLDTQFYMYNEDVDLSLRAWVAGWKVMFTPHSVMHHMRGKSKAPTTQQDYLGLRNSLTTLLKNYQRSSMRHYSRTLYQTFLAPTASRWQMKAGWYNFLRLPSILKRRQRIQAMRKQSDVEWFRQVPFQTGWYAPGVTTHGWRADGAAR